MKLPSSLAALFAASLVCSSLPVEAGDPPAFPGQPSINATLRHLNAAKEKVSSDATGALTELEEAHNSMGHAIKKKGTYQPMARQFMDQATEYLKKGDTEKASHKIDEAIATVTKAGETGEH